jgi:hypothetical protein
VPGLLVKGDQPPTSITDDDIANHWHGSLFIRCCDG